MVEASFNLLRVPKWKVGTAVLGFVLSFEKHLYNHIMPIVYFIMKLDRGKQICGSTNVLLIVIIRNHLMVFKFLQKDFIRT